HRSSPVRHHYAAFVLLPVFQFLVFLLFLAFSWSNGVDEPLLEFLEVGLYIVHLLHLRLGRLNGLRHALLVVRAPCVYRLCQSTQNGSTMTNLAQTHAP